MYDESQENPNPDYKTLVIIWGAMLVSIAIYAGIAEFLLFSKNDPASADITIYYILLGLAVMEILAIPFIKSHVSKLGWLPSETPTHTEVIQAKQSKFVTSHIVAFAIAESAALYGFVLAFALHGNKVQFYTFMTIAAVAMLIHFPGKTKWDSIDGMR